MTSDPVARIRAGQAWRPIEAAVWLLPVLAFFLLPQRLTLLADVAVLALFALSLDLLVGRVGIISLGHAAFFGVGGYTVGLLAQAGWGEPLSGLVAGGVVAGAAGFVTSFLVLRGRDLTQLMVTLGIALMLFELANKLPGLTGGIDGLQGIEIWPVLGLWDFDLYGRTAYVYSMAVLFVGFLAVRRLVGSPFGLLLRGLKQNERRMRALGVPVQRRQVAIYTISAALAGVAGGLLTETTQFVSIGVLAFDRSAEALLIVVLGGSGTLYGPIAGALLFKVAKELLSSATPQFWPFWMGLVLVALVFFARGGVMGLLARLSALRGGTAATRVAVGK